VEQSECVILFNNFRSHVYVRISNVHGCFPDSPYEYHFVFYGQWESTSWRHPKSSYSRSVLDAPGESD
jgi:hypothetical protein